MKTIDNEIQNKLYSIMDQWDKDIDLHKAGKMTDQDYNAKSQAYEKEIRDIFESNEKVKIVTTVRDNSEGAAIVAKLLNKYIACSGTLAAFGAALFAISKLVF